MVSRGEGMAQPGASAMRWASRAALLAASLLPSGAPLSGAAMVAPDRRHVLRAGMPAFAPPVLGTARLGAPRHAAWSGERHSVHSVHTVRLPRSTPSLLTLQAQRQGSTRSVDMATKTKQTVQKTVFGVLGGLAVSLAAAYCAYTGQNPVEVIQAIASSDPQQVLKDSVEYIDGLGPLGYLYFSVIYVVAEMFAIPAVPLTASAGYLFGVIPGTCIVLFSATIAAGGAFIIGRTFLRQFVEEIIDGSRKFQAIDEAISRKGFQLVLLLRLSPLLPFALSNYLYGMTKVNLLEYLAGTAIGFAPGSLGFVMTGQVGRDLVAGDAGGSSGLPWYAYAGGITAVVVIGKVVAGVAAKAIAEVEAEFDAKEAAKMAKMQGQRDEWSDELGAEDSEEILIQKER